MSVAADLATRIRMSDPKPAFCSSCHCGADAGTEFVDFNAAFDSGAFQDQDTLAYIAGSDDLHICVTCLQNACDAAALKPEFHQSQTRFIRQVELERDHWKDTAKRLKRELDRQLEAGFGDTKRKAGA